MTDRYEVARKAYLRQIEESEHMERFTGALNRMLPNDGEDVCYDSWLAAIDRFSEENKVLFMEMGSNG